MKKTKTILISFIMLTLIFITNTYINPISIQNNPGFKFEISFPSLAHPEPITGQIYVIISTEGRRESRLQTGFDLATGIPFWGNNIYALKPEERASINEDMFGFPLKSIREIPTGEYYVQGVINIYTEFKRSDGHTLWLHNDQWEGQRWNISPVGILGAANILRSNNFTAEGI